VLFLDEPTSGLDPVATREVRELIEGLRGRGVTVFLTTHRLEEAERLCDRIAILNTTLRIIGRPEELRRKLFSPSLEVELAAPLDDMDALVSGLAGATGWRATGAATYVITAHEPNGVTPTKTLTITKLRWLADAEPDNAAKVAAVALPHDWLTWQIGGQAFDPVTDRGDGSGTCYFDAAANAYRPRTAQ